MKNYIILWVAISLISCGGNSEVKKADSESVATISAKSNLITFKVNGETVNTSGWNISRFTWKEGGPQWLNITTNMHEDKRTIMANLDSAVPGTYTFSEESGIKSSHADYKPDYMGDMMKSYSFVSGSFTITEVDTIKNRISGSFSGKVKNNAGEVMEITEGKIVNGELKPGVTHY